MDVRFSSAIHMLILISEATTPMSSNEIAISVGANSSYVRKILVLLKNKKIIKSSQGKAGFRLNVPAKKLSLYDIYKAIYETDNFHIFDIHNNPNDKCIVGKHIKPVLKNVYKKFEINFSNELRNKSLEDVMNDMRKKIK